MIHPIQPFQLTQGYGENPANYKQFGLAGHNGWDYKTKFPDTPQGYRDILSVYKQTFYKRGNEGTKGYGIYFETTCQLKSLWKLTYAHCLNVDTFVEKVEGQRMATSDSTGNSSGSHLHFTVKRIKIVNGVHQVQNYNNGYFGAVNPQEFFDELKLQIPPTNGGVPVNYQQGSGKFDQVVKLLNQNKLIDYDNPERYYSNDDVINAIKRLIENQGNKDAQNKLDQAKALGKQIAEL